MESARIFVSILDGNDVWFVDDVYGGIYRINKLDDSNAAECVIDSKVLYKNGKYTIADIACDESELIIVPQDFQFPLCIYNKKDGSIRDEYVKDVPYKVARALYDGKILALLPLFTTDALITIDADKWIISSEKKGVFQDSINSPIWEYSCVEETYYVPIVSSSSIVKISDDMSSTDICKLSDGEKIASVCVKEGLWVLPIQGDYIKHYDKNGNLIECINMILNKDELTYLRIVCVGNYLILLPQKGRKLMIYDIISCETKTIDLSERMLSNIIPNEKREDLAYWNYYIDEKKICLLPLSRKMFLFNSINGLYKFRDIFVISEDEANEFRKNEIKTESEEGLVREKYGFDLNLFLQIV